MHPSKYHGRTCQLKATLQDSEDTSDTNDRNDRGIIMMDTDKARKHFSSDRYAALTGIEIVEAGKGYCTTRLVIDDRHLNAANVVQGGAIFTLADLAFAVASNSHGQLALAINVSISFLCAKSSGILYARATEAAKPNRLGVYDVIVTDEQEIIIARFHGMVYRKKEKLPGYHQ